MSTSSTPSIAAIFIYVFQIRVPTDCLGCECSRKYRWLLNLFRDGCLSLIWTGENKWFHTFANTLRPKYANYKYAIILIIIMTQTKLWRLCWRHAIENNIHWNLEGLVCCEQTRSSGRSLVHVSWDAFTLRPKQFNDDYFDGYVDNVNCIWQNFNRYRKVVLNAKAITLISCQRTNRKCVWMLVDKPSCHWNSLRSLKRNINEIESGAACLCHHFELAVWHFSHSSLQCSSIASILCGVSRFLPLGGMRTFRFPATFSG